MAKALKDRYPGAALITGASAGLGESFARRLAREGFELVLVARREDRLRDLADALQAEHEIKAHPLAVDLAAPDCAEQTKAGVDALGIEVGMLINNAGFGSHGYFHEQDPAGEARMVDVNCRAPVLLTSAFAPAMVERGNGALIYLASTAAYQPTPFLATYGATKAFDLMFGEAIWAELKPHGVDVLSLSPGYTRTEFQEVAKVTALPPSFFWAQPDEVVDTCFERLGRTPSAIDGAINYLTAFSIRFAPRRWAAGIAKQIGKP